MAVEVRARRCAPALDGVGDRVGDGREADASGEEGLDRDLVGGVEDGAAVAAGVGRRRGPCRTRDRRTASGGKARVPHSAGAVVRATEGRRSGG